jgi:GTP-binding protein
MIKSAKYIKSYYQIEDLPTPDKPVVFLLGRSNVGKSSFINYISNQHHLARTSSVPGKTIALNYYLLDNNYYLVDAPGYGYAKHSKLTLQKWDNFLTKYFNRITVNLVLHLMDSKVGATDKDIIANNFIKEFVQNVVFIMTKADKINQSEMSATFKRTKNVFSDAILNENLFFISTKSNKNKDKVIKKIYEYL